MIGISGLGLLTALFLKEIPMKNLKDEKYGLDGENKKSTSEDEVMIEGKQAKSASVSV